MSNVLGQDPIYLCIPQSSCLCVGGECALEILLCFELHIVSAGWSCKNLNQVTLLPDLKAFNWFPRQWIPTPPPYHGQQGPAWQGSCPSPPSTPRPSRAPGHLAFFLFLQYHNSFPPRGLCCFFWLENFPWAPVLAPFHPLDFNLNVTSSVRPPPDHSIEICISPCISLLSISSAYLFLPSPSI